MEINHYCRADRRSSTTTWNPQTSSSSSVCSSSTRSDASGTTSHRRYSSPAPGWSLHDRIPDPSYRISSRWLSIMSGSCWRRCQAIYFLLLLNVLSCMSLYWRTARESSHRPSPHSPTCHCGPESSQHASNQRRCCRYWRRRGSLPVNYRPISNLSTVSKVLERLVLARLRPHLTNSKNFSKRQSAYRQGHSTKTALLDVLYSVHTTRKSHCLSASTCPQPSINK